MHQDIQYFRDRELQEREAAARADCEIAKNVHLALACLHAHRARSLHLGGSESVVLDGVTREELVASLQHNFGENALHVARRQMRLASGQSLATWSEVVRDLEERQGWLGHDSRRSVGSRS